MSTQADGDSKNPLHSDSPRIEILWQTASVLEAGHLRHSIRPHERRLMLDQHDRSFVRDDIRIVGVVGAGASADRYPRAQEVSNYLRSVLGDQFSDRDARHQARLSGRSSEAFEAKLAAMASTPDRANATNEILEELFGASRPTTGAYELIAHLLKHRYLDAVINFNFDELLDDSIRIEMGEREYKFVVSDRSCDGIITDPSDPAYLPLHIKPHGTASERQSLRYTFDSYLNPAAQVPGLLAELFGTGALLILNFGFGLQDQDFCELLARPSRISVVDCSYQPIGADARRALARYADAELVEETRWSSDSGGNKDRSGIRLARDFGVDDDTTAERRRGSSAEPPGGRRSVRSAYENEGGPSSTTCVWSGGNLTYYWLDHSWLATGYAKRSPSTPGEEERPAQEPNQPHEWPTGSNPPIDNLRRSYVESVLKNSGNPVKFDPSALQLLDLVALLDDRARPESTIPAVDLRDRVAWRGAATEALHLYRLEIRHLIVGLYGELTTLKGPWAPDAERYWHERTLLELAMYLVESGGLTTVEDVAVSRARRCYDRYRLAGGAKHFQDVVEELGITDGPRGTLVLADTERSKRLRKSSGIRLDGSADDQVDSGDDPKTEGGVDQSDRAYVAAGLAPPGREQRIDRLVENLLRSCSSVSGGRDASFREFLRPALKAMSVSLMRDDLVGREDRVCTGVFRSPTKLHTHTALNAYSRLALKRLNPVIGDSRGEAGAFKGRSELWASCASSQLLNDAFLFADVGRSAMGSSRFRRDFLLRIVASDIELRDLDLTRDAGAEKPTGYDEDQTGRAKEIRKRLENQFGRSGDELSIEVQVRQMVWWRLNRHLLLSIVDGTPVAGVYYARPRLSRSLSPVFLTDPSDLSILEAIFERTWDSAEPGRSDHGERRKGLVSR